MDVPEPGARDTPGIWRTPDGIFNYQDYIEISGVWKGRWSGSEASKLRPGAVARIQGGVLP